jgi:hypothetical protein
MINEKRIPRSGEGRRLSRCLPNKNFKPWWVTISPQSPLIFASLPRPIPPTTSEICHDFDTTFAECSA